MKKHVFFLIPLAIGFLAGCAGTKPVQKPVQRDPDPRAVELFIDGILYDQEQNFAAGLLSYQEAMLYDTTSPTIYLSIGRDYLLLGRDGSALINLEKCVRMDPKNVEARSLVARVYLNMGQWHMAEKAFLGVLSVDSTDTDACNNLALLYLKQNQAEKAAEMLTKIVTVDDDPDPQVFYQLARLYADMKQYDKAEGLYKRMIEVDSRDGFGFYGMGTVFEAKGDTAGAEEKYRRALALSPDLAEARERLGDLYTARKQFDDAVKLYAEAVESDTSDMNSLLALGGVYEEKGDTVRAEAAFRTARSRFSKEIQPFLDSGNFYMNRQRFDAAYREFQKAVKLAPGNYWGWLFSGVALVQMDSLNKALTVLLHASAMIPDDPMGNFYIGSVLTQLRRPAESLPYLDKALQVRPKWISALNALAGTYDSLKEYALSDSLYGTALQIEPDNALVLNNWSYSLS
ncbi:MAG TPA: tetratricopeptide repeat protein, partial [bacterium]